MLSVGQVCFKTKGRTSGDKVVIVDHLKNGFLVIEGLKTKRKPCNPIHLTATSRQIRITKETKRDEIIKQLKEA